MSLIRRIISTAARSGGRAAATPPAGRRGLRRRPEPTTKRTGIAALRSLLRR